MEKKTIPASLDECIIRSNTVNKLLNWAEKLQKIGNALLIVTIISGVITTIVNAANMDPDNPATVTSFVVSLVFTVLGALFIYVMNNFLVMVLNGLGETAHNTEISANVALFVAANGNRAPAWPETPASPSSPDGNPQTAQPSPQLASLQRVQPPQKIVVPTEPVPVAVQGDRLVCPTCHTSQRSNRKVCFNCGTKFLIDPALAAASDAVNPLAQTPAANAQAPSSADSWEEQARDRGASLPEGAVRVKLDFGNVVCPICSTRQPGNRTVCSNCGTQFIVEQ